MGHGGGEEECWINPAQYMKFRNQRMMLKESFSKQLQKAHAGAQQLAAQETGGDDAVIEVSPKRFIRYLELKYKQTQERLLLWRHVTRSKTIGP